MITMKKFVRKPLYVEAVRITRDNFEEMATYCQGDIRFDPKGKGSRKKYIHVRVHNPKNERQKTAFVGDWLLYTETGYKVYTNKAFNLAFDLAEGFADLVEEARATGNVELPGAEEEIEDEVIETPPDVGVDAFAQPNARLDVTTGKDSTAILGEPLDEPYEETAIPQPNEVAVDESDSEKVRVPPPADAGGMAGYSTTVPSDAVSEMKKAKALIEAEGGSVEEATPEGIADAVNQANAARLAAEAAGKRVLSEEEQKTMDSDEIRALLESGEVVLAQDLAA